ncbi:AcrR family transcriptional regulator [Actinoalloteichus hoggarensis]|uniref:Transcriptional regulator BetI n=1 Tax=Actinoalloteichus hoggarensis TaxID=1470176 RepID=A0A221W6M2_9PSEU|nr:TetR/AcrR family transcriptional regulator [Actinoalloteichus hoggarensis]ASO21047.1 transcriptional regulator BetI [Actinoalloteichus hoggarensis]MBB5920978.1 AcrR family transcriptional regulator [Actinoalloteichus hoggarensis]
MEEIGLRERKRRATRQCISDRATRLFERDGFENVTLAQIAAAADVSVKTVTNYFGAKEDLFFDAEPAVLDALVATIAGRSTTTTPEDAIRPLALDGPLLADHRAWASVSAAEWAAMRAWSRCERDSPTLSTRRSAVLHSWLEPLARAEGSRPWAALVVGLLMLRHDILRDGLVGDAHPADIERDVREQVGRGFELLDQARPDRRGPRTDL